MIKCKVGVLTRGRLFFFILACSGGNELEAEFGGFLFHVLDLLFFVLLLVLVHADRFIFHYAQMLIAEVRGAGGAPFWWSSGEVGGVTGK